MGSKVSSGKMAAASRVVQVVRPHAPLIKFPNRQDMAKPNVQDALKLLIANIPHTAGPASVSASVSASAPATAAAQSATPPPRPAGLISRLPGTPDSIAVIKELPQRYRRRPLALEEMDYIQRGGPE